MGLYEDLKLDEMPEPQHQAPKRMIPDYLKSIESRRILNDGHEADDWEPCFWYVSSITGERTPLAGKTELVVVTGEKKARKSLLLSVFASSRYEHVDADHTLGYELQTEGPILYFDTEQPRRRVKRNRQRYHQVIGFGDKKDDQTLIQYSLRGRSPHEMREIIGYTIDELIRVGNPPGVIMLDQVADLVTSRDENDKAGAVEVMDYLNSWIDKTGALMMVTIHTNRQGLQTNGRVGSFLDQKTDCTFRLNMDENWITEITHLYSREKRMPAIRFGQNFDGLPHFVSETPGAKSFF